MPNITNENSRQRLALTLLKSHWLQAGIGCTTATALVILSLATGGLPLVAMIPIAIISVLLTLGLGRDFYVETFKRLFRRRKFDSDTFLGLSTLALMGLSVAALFVPWLPVMFEVGIMIHGIWHLSKAVQKSLPNFRLASAVTQSPWGNRLRKATSYLFPLLFLLTLGLGLAATVMIGPFAGIQIFIGSLFALFPHTLGLLYPVAAKIGLQKTVAEGIDINMSNLIKANHCDAILFDFEVPPPQEHLKEVIAALRAMGKQVYMCVSQPEEQHDTMAAALGLPCNNIYNATTGDRRTAALQIAFLKSKGIQVALVGNSAEVDLPSMNAADYRIVIRATTTNDKHATKAHAIIPNLRSLISLAQIAQQTQASFQQNFAMTLGLNAGLLITSAVLLFACGLVLNPAVGVAFMGLQAGFIFVNIARFKNQPVYSSKEVPPENDGFSPSLMLKRMPSVFSPAPKYSKKAEIELDTSPQKNKPAVPATLPEKKEHTTSAEPPRLSCNLL